VKYKSTKKCQKKFRRKFPYIRTPYGNTIQNPVKKVRKCGVLVDKKTGRRRTVLTEEIVDNFRAQLKHTPRESLRPLAQERGTSREAARRAIKRMKC
jgi:hypothetical protein